MSKQIGVVYKDSAKWCKNHYYSEIKIERFVDRGFDYLLKQNDDTIALTEKQFFTLYMEMKREIDNINNEESNK